MRAAASLSIALALGLSGPALAEPATPDGAKAIEQAYAAWLSQGVLDKGILSVAPQGDDYLVTWDLPKALDLAKAPPEAVKTDKFTYLVTPGADDSWKVKADHFPNVAFNIPTDKGRASGVVDLSALRFEASYDGKLPQFLLAAATAAAVSGKVHLIEADGPADMDFSETGVALTMKGDAADNGVDITLAQAIKGLAETTTIPTEKGAPPVKITFAGGAANSDAHFSGLRAREIGDLWKYAVAHAHDTAPPADLRERVTALLPLWGEFRATSDITDLSLDAPIPEIPIHAEMKGFSEIVGLSGFAPHAFAEFGVKLTDFSAKISLLPDWATQVQPVSLDFDMKASVDGMDQVAKLALDDPNFGGKGDLSPETEKKIGAILLNGHPRLTIAPGRFATPALEVSYEGEVTSAGDKPSGSFTIGANGLDKAQALLQEVVKTFPEAQPGLLVVAFVKGLATTGADGRLVWKVEVKPDGGVIVNGTPMPTGN